MSSLKLEIGLYFERYTREGQLAKIAFICGIEKMAVKQQMHSSLAFIRRTEGKILIRKLAAK